MFQIFYADGAKVDQDIAYVTMVVHICYKCLFSILHLFFQMYVTNVFIWMLHMFHTYVTSVLSGCCICLQLFFQVFFMCFCKCFRRMFQMFSYFRTYVASVLCILQCEPPAAATCCSCGDVVHGGEQRSRREGRRKQGSVGEQHGRGLPMCAAGADVWTRGSVRTSGRWCCQ
jgi:hypothetical protein